METLEEMRALARMHAAGAHQSVPLLDGVSLTVVGGPTPPVVAMTRPSFAVVAQGVKRTTLHGRHHDYRPGQFLVTTLDLPVIGQALQATREKPLVVVSMMLRPAELAPLLCEAAAPAGGSRRDVGSPGLAVSTAPPELLESVVRLLRLINRPDDLRVLAPGVRREILWHLLTGDQGALVRQIGVTDGPLARISRSIRWIRQHYDEPVAVSELAALASMSPSTFHRHFRAATSMTPIQFRQQTRLHVARTLLTTRRTTDIAEIGYTVGYESPSQFSREYRRVFGASPGEDADRLRATTHLPVP